MLAVPGAAWAQAQGGAPLVLPRLQLGFGAPASSGEVATGLQILALLTVLTLAPSILVMMTSFTRIVIVLAFMRQALGMQQTPPNPVLIGLALFLTFFSMAPVGTRIHAEALQPYLSDQIDYMTALRRAEGPLRKFMLHQTREKDLALFVSLSKQERPATPADVPTTTIIPAFLISELKTAFQIGFMLFIPFLIVDMVIASILLSLGMMMLPPVLVSLPFKLMLFVMVDGWALLVGSLMQSFG
ncbi:MAG: flagellar type III secretion system pore protein FliP [Candidatus Tectomicrobia bacterium]|uniref:Flagellar biosynthetic protein FliP n=1 Tax=Tectimicrobiota bacterium TaxID=2528274 RepID=A0A932I2Z4_UNCTE|nr:flagellar type III secretion system pore protein FliP [Candidatus Tectomicrobia bacterium]